MSLVLALVLFLAAPSASTEVPESPLCAPTQVPGEQQAQEQEPLFLDHENWETYCEDECSVWSGCNSCCNCQYDLCELHCYQSAGGPGFPGFPLCIRTCEDGWNFCMSCCPGGGC